MHSTHAKHNSTASTKKRKRHLEPSLIFHAVRARFHAKATTPGTVAHASHLFSQRNLGLPEKTQCFVQILTFTFKLNCIRDVAIPMRPANNDLQNTIKLARHYWRTNTLRAALVSTLLDPTLLNLYPYSTLPLPLPLPLPLLYLYSALLYSALLYSTLPYSTPTLLIASLLYAALLYSAQVPVGHNDPWASENVC